MAQSQVVVITGASAGVGRATAIAFARRGARLGLLARGHAGLEAARRDVVEAGGEAIALPTDVSDPDQVEAAASRVEAAFGPLDVWVNNAMVSVFSPIQEMTAADFKRVTEVTYLGYVHGTLSALKRMRPRDAGVIVQVGSALAYRSIPLQSAYCAAKHAIVGFTDSLRSELLHDRSRVRVTAVHLPALNTPQFDWVLNRLPRKAQPVPPIFQPEVAARAIVWASAHERREVYVGGSTLQAILGQKVIPGLLDRYLARVGYEKQQTDGPEAPDRPDNLRSPVDQGRDFGAHGRFDARATDRSPALWLSEHRRLVAAAGLGVASLAIAAASRNGRRR